MHNRYATLTRWSAAAIGLALFLMLASRPSNAQRAPMTIDIPASEPFILNLAAAQAVEGDTLLLVTGGDESVYLDTAIHVDKSLTFRADPSLSSPPKVHFHWEEQADGGSGHQFILEAGDITVDGIVFGREEADSLNQYFSFEGDEPRTVRIHNSEFRFGGKMITNTVQGDLDTLIITDTYVHDFERNAVEIDFASDAPNFVQIHNSTFANVRNAVDMRGGGASSVLDVDHVTADQVNFAFDVQKVDSDWSLDSRVRNSVATRSRTLFRWNGYYPEDPDSALISNSLYYDLRNAFGNEAQGNETIIEEEDPLYVQPDEWPYDFSYQEGSPAIAAATDGTDLGDLRWNTTVVSVEGPELPPASPQLHQNYPNPFNPSTEITFELAVASRVSLAVYDVLGRHVATVVDGHRSAGAYTTRFDASNLSSGMYIYRLTTGDEVVTRSMTVVK